MICLFCIEIVQVESRNVEFLQARTGTKYCDK